MTVIAQSVPLVLSPGGVTSVSTPTVPLPAKTDTVTLTIKREPSAGVVWPATCKLRIRVVISIDGEQYIDEGSSTGGVRLNPADGSNSNYALTYGLPQGWFGDRSAKPRRLGERNYSSYTAQVTISLDPSSITGIVSEISASSTESDAPQVPSHSSVAYDTSASASEVSGDGTVSATASASGSNRAAFVGHVNVSNDGSYAGSTSATYGGVSMTEAWDVNWETDKTNAGYYLAAPATGSQTVSAVMGGASFFAQYITVVTMTGVDQSSPVGSAPTPKTGNSATPSVIVANTSTDGMVVDLVGISNATAPTAGVGQTSRQIVAASGNGAASSTQPSWPFGGEMSWSISSDQWSIGAIEFKAFQDVAYSPYTPTIAPSEVQRTGGLLTMLSAMRVDQSANQRRIVQGALMNFANAIFPPPPEPAVDPNLDKVFRPSKAANIFVAVWARMNKIVGGGSINPS